MSPVDRPQLASAVASVRAVDETPGSSREAAPVEYLSKPISQLRTMHDRVLAHNPLPGETESPLTDINPGQWRVVTLQHVQPDGSRAIVERGVPLDEVKAEGLSVGRRLYLTLAVVVTDRLAQIETTITHSIWKKFRLSFSPK